jgi:hypothetical protein
MKGVFWQRNQSERGFAGELAALTKSILAAHVESKGRKKHLTP